MISKYGDGDLSNGTETGLEYRPGPQGLEGGGASVAVDGSAALRAALVDLRLYSNSPYVRRLTVALCAKLKFKTTDPRKFLVAVGFVALNVIRNRANDHRRLLVVSRDRNCYAGLLVSYAILVNVIDAMVSAGLIEMVAKGFKNRANPGPNNGYRTRYRATPAFFELIAEYGVTPSMVVTRERRNDSLIVIRHADDKKRARWPSFARAEREVMKSNLKTINAALKGTFIALHVSDTDLDAIHAQVGREKASKPLDFYSKQMHRVFHDASPTKGGRFYGGWWQSVPRDYRKYIHVAKKGGYPTYTHELDYSAMHPSMLYAMAKEQCPEEPYAIYDNPLTNKASRRVVKVALLAMINCSDRSAALRATNSDVKEYYQNRVSPHDSRPTPATITEMLPDGCPPVPKLVADIERKHSAIKEQFYTGIGKELMYRDSQIAEQVMLKFILKCGSLVLPVHDSFIVRKGYETDLERYMKEEFESAFGVGIDVKHDTTERDVLAEQYAKDKRLIDIFDTKELTEGNAQDPYTVYNSLLSDWEHARNV